MNSFGGNWTERKIEIIVEYASAYLQVMKGAAVKYNWKLLYFDGFAGSGYINKVIDGEKRVITGAARRILEIEKPIRFDDYYFVEKDQQFAEELSLVKSDFPDHRIHIVSEDCNEKIKSMGEFLRTDKGKHYKVLSYIDPYGMQLSWDSLEELKEANVDVWILVPTGMGVNRLLTKNGNISEAWLERLELFLGMKRTDILDNFYNVTTCLTLFGNETRVNKIDDAIEKSAQLYKSRLNQLFKYVTEPYVLKNRTNSVMFHFFMASNNPTAYKIGNSIVNKYNRMN